MLITPRPGASRESLLEALRTVHIAASKARNAGQPNAYNGPGIPAQTRAAK
ncbi:hypothetical protein [Streptomyces sp. NPDC056982]|uniref:hypothetical protein n=1 Tax=Streptomyces sp. NPDC056982 TaxID=3345986 RepID=UPI0036286A26